MGFFTSLGFSRKSMMIVSRFNLESNDQKPLIFIVQNHTPNTLVAPPALLLVTLINSKKPKKIQPFLKIKNANSLALYVLAFCTAAVCSYSFIHSFSLPVDVDDHHIE